MDQAKPVSRRNMMISSVAALLAPAVISGQARAAETSTSPKANKSIYKSDRHMTAIDSSDPEFAQKVEHFFPGLQNDPGFKIIAPLATLVSHHHGPAVKAYTVCWETTTRNGSYQTALFHFSTRKPSHKRQSKSGKIKPSAERNLLQPGNIHLVTPFFAWSPQSFRNKPSPNWQQLITHKEPGSFMASQLKIMTHVKIWLDGAVFADNRVAGPDHKKLAKRIQVRRNAEHDESAAVLRLMRSGTSDAEIKQALRARASAGRSTAQGHQYWYEQARRYHAHVLLTHFNKVDRPTFKKSLVHFKRQPKTLILRAKA